MKNRRPKMTADHISQGHLHKQKMLSNKTLASLVMLLEKSLREGHKQGRAFRLNLLWCVPVSPLCIIYLCFHFRGKTSIRARERMQRGRCDGQFIIGDGTLVISPKKWSRPFSHFRRECMLARAVMDRFIYFLLCWRGDWKRNGIKMGTLIYELFPG